MVKNNDIRGKGTEKADFFDSQSYIIQLDCKRKELFHAFDQFNNEKIVTPVLRSFLHEHTHFLQHATTPVGYYLKILRDFQLIYFTIITQENLNTQKFSYPMMPLIWNEKSKSNKYRLPAHYYYYWVLAEIVRLILIGDYETLSYYTERMMYGEGLTDYFMELEQYLNKVLSGETRSCKRKMKKHSDIELKRIRLGIFNNAFSNLNITSAMESQALLSEYYFDEIADEFLIKAIGKSNYQEDQMHYLLPLRLYQTAYSFDLRKKSDFLSFKLGFNAVCQIVFHAPILPFQDEIGPYSLGEIDINARFNELILVPSISPPKSLSDYNRYINELLTERSYILLKKSCGEIFRHQKMILENRFGAITSLCKTKEHIFLSAQKSMIKIRLIIIIF